MEIEKIRELARNAGLLEILPQSNPGMLSFNDAAKKYRINVYHTTMSVTVQPTANSWRMILNAKDVPLEKLTSIFKSPEGMMSVQKNGKQFFVGTDYSWFWEGFHQGTWEPHTFDILDRFLESDRDYFDIGAWIGPTVLYASDRCKDVYAFEPDPVAYAELLKNIDLNLIPNCAALQAAAGIDNGKIKIGKRGKFGDSMSSVLWEDGEMIEVISLSVASMIRSKKPNFIKMDIEGGEMTVLPSMKEALIEVEPTLYLSLHAPWFENKEEYMAIIKDVLSIYPNWYDETGKKIEDLSELNPNGFTSIVASFM